MLSRGGMGKHAQGSMLEGKNINFLNFPFCHYVVSTAALSAVAAAEQQQHQTESRKGWESGQELAWNADSMYVQYSRRVSEGGKGKWGGNKPSVCLGTQAVLFFPLSRL